MLVGAEEFFEDHLAVTTITLHSTLPFRSGLTCLTMPHSQRPGSTRDQEELLFSGRALMRDKKTFLKCPVKKLPFHKILKTVPGVMSHQGPF